MFSLIFSLPSTPSTPDLANVQVLDEAHEGLGKPRQLRLRYALLPELAAPRFLIPTESQKMPNFRVDRESYGVSPKSLKISPRHIIAVSFLLPGNEKASAIRAGRG